MTDIQKIVVVGFYYSDYSHLVRASVSFYANDDWVILHLADWDYQSLIESIDAVWPNWTDADQSLARSE